MISLFYPVQLTKLAEVHIRSSYAHIDLKKCLPLLKANYASVPAVIPPGVRSEFEVFALDAK